MGEVATEGLRVNDGRTLSTQKTVVINNNGTLHRCMYYNSKCSDKVGVCV